MNLNSRFVLPTIVFSMLRIGFVDISRPQAMIRGDGLGTVSQDH